MATIVDARGKACPQPVIETKKALKENGAPVIVLVDNDIARQNVEKMAVQLNLSAQTDMTEDGAFRVLIQQVSSEVLGAVLNDAADALSGMLDTMPAVDCVPCMPVQNGKTVVVLSSNCMGVGDDTLGAALMKGFVYALTQLDTAPDTVLLYNGGAKLSVEGAETVQDLKILEENGTEILTCGTCLNHYGLTDKLAVGEVTNMYTIAEKMSEAGKVIRP
ncbi:MAG TPA: sulfurtransferase-like selenium metabolism protein YedF [Candidatus Butyricicoccus avistercoris]|uniref:Sulfurtransferase-like selenium metabolism protein YedF n=1 Tax=Candidatus Butyricicoccus avistercoris TaxID=2838518 RepID=A0A9D1PIN1_9FIRM|nr:sulfurtransferase-like selenium metabolism protein YedF [Candidatus Butyricicoccus avistercoris]